VSVNHKNTFVFCFCFSKLRKVGRKQITTLLKSTVFQHMTPYSLTEVPWWFGGMYCLHFQGRRISGASKEREAVSFSETSINFLHGFTFQKRVLFTIIAERTRSRSDTTPPPHLSIQLTVLSNDIPCLLYISCEVVKE
jgi:hypothetical protein